MMSSRVRVVLLWSVYAALYAPLLGLVIASFNVDRFGLGWQGFSLQWYAALLSNRVLLGACLNSLLLASAVALLTTTVGFFCCIVLRRYDFLGRGLLKGSLLIAMLAPDIVMGLAFLLSFLFFRFPLGFFTLLLAHTAFCLPFSVMVISSAFKDSDQTLLEVAKDLGAGEGTILFSILLPLLRPSILGSAIFSFILSMDDVVVSSFVTAPALDLLSLKIYSMVRVGISPEVNALTTVLLLGNFLLMGLLWLRAEPEKHL